MDFDPNALPKPIKPEWATYIPTRRGKKFKIHNGRGQAVNALNYLMRHQEGILYRLMNDQWVEVDRLEKKLECDKCGAKFKTTTLDGGVWPREMHIVKPEYKNPVVCESCYRDLGGGKNDEAVDELLKKLGVRR